MPDAETFHHPPEYSLDEPRRSIAIACSATRLQFASAMLKMNRMLEQLSTVASVERMRNDSGISRLRVFAVASTTGHGGSASKSSGLQ